MRKPVSQIAIYESRGRGKVVGFFDVGRIVEEPPAGIWRRYAKVAGVTKAEFFEYFAQSVSGVAIEIKKFHELRSPIPLQDLNPAYRPPQSFFYITEEEFGLIQRSA